ncbi:MAG: TRAP transporter substrate-binding protein DctP, partial [Clostridiaceae bacterium]|nr:TRAP transporter substrate-binding protein DctP [Clostridiaceae bacterium]
MKKYVSLLMVLVMVLSLAAGCSPKTETASGTTPTETGTEKKAPIVIKYGHICAEDHSVHQSALKFKEYVEKESNGEITVEIYPNGILGGDVQMTEAVALGTLQMALPTTSILVMYSPIFGALDMPF